MINLHWRQYSLQCVNARLCIQIPRVKIQTTTVEKNMMWKPVNKGRETSLHFTPVKQNYPIEQGKAKSHWRDKKVCFFSVCEQPV